MTIPVSIGKLEYEGEKPILRKCRRNTYNYYENYLFGKNINTITSAEDTNIYKGTFQNLNNISGQNINNATQSIGGSYNIFSTQVEANR